ncbi:UPF0262 family protein [Inquilinus sp. Marseille-Q2685]|uniref:UPF0262 family protein n=1 Tax=Inquilinus sp. Marseille-Q2685 TaxID=2866581 RepID=UPI001CE3E462|nr:UPF0262 family protein [Inquilinus sp. Marseille-Q2685]
MNRAAGDAEEGRLVEVVIDESAAVRRSPEVAHERRVAIHDLIEQNSFRLVEGPPGPYRLRLRMEENRLIFEVATGTEGEPERVALPIQPFRRIIKDYFLVCESYYAAIKTAPPSRIEAIDMGRRGLHDEGSVLLGERLADRIAMDHATARRLFTLLCVLQIRG